MALAGEMPASEAYRRSPALGGVSECAGRNDEMTVRSRPRNQKRFRAPSHHNIGEGSRPIPKATKGMAARRGKGASTRTRTWVETGKGSSPRGENPRKQGSRANRKAKRGEGESPTDGSVVAMKRGNARRAKGPYRRQSK